MSQVTHVMSVSPNAHSISKSKYVEYAGYSNESACFSTGWGPPGTRCPVGCVFCSNYGWDEDYMDCWPYPDEEECRRMAESVSPTLKNVVIAGGEPFASKHAIRTALQVAKSLPDTTFYLATTAVLMNPRYIGLINSIPNLHVALSIHTFDKEVRKTFQRAYNGHEWAIEAVRNLENISIYLSELGGVELLKRDIDTLFELRDGSCPFVYRRIEYTKKSSKEGIRVAQQSISQFENGVRYLTMEAGDVVKRSARFHVPYVEWYYRYDIEGEPDHHMSIHPHSYVSRVKQWADSHTEHRILFCSAESAHSFWREKLTMYPNIDVINVKNYSQGGSVNTAGLLHIEDFDRAFSKILPEQYDIALLPPIACFAVQGLCAILNKKYPFSCETL